MIKQQFHHHTISETDSFAELVVQILIFSVQRRKKVSISALDNPVSVFWFSWAGARQRMAWQSAPVLLLSDRCCKSRRYALAVLSSSPRPATWAFTKSSVLSFNRLGDVKVSRQYVIDWSFNSAPPLGQFSAVVYCLMVFPDIVINSPGIGRQHFVFKNNILKW